MNARRISIDVKYDNQTITAVINPFITDISYSDNFIGQVDDISISLGDREKKWMNEWSPKKGASLEASLLISDGWGSTKSSRRNLGYFEIDEVSTSGPPNKVSVKGISIPQSSTLRGQAKSRSWENTNFKKVANDIAKWNGMKLYFSGIENPTYDRISQDNESDVSFLVRICNEAGFALKVANKTLYLFDEVKFEGEPVVDTISRTDFRLKDYSGKDTLSHIYKACTVVYTHPKSKKTVRYTYTPPKPPKTNRILVVNEEVSSQGAALTLAKKRLREANKSAVTFSIKLAGFANYYAGQTVNLKDFGTFNGKYIITSMRGSVGNNSETSLELRRCLEGY